MNYIQSVVHATAYRASVSPKYKEISVADSRHRYESGSLFSNLIVERLGGLVYRVEAGMSKAVDDEPGRDIQDVRFYDHNQNGVAIISVFFRDFGLHNICVETIESRDERDSGKVRIKRVLNNRFNESNNIITTTIADFHGIRKEYHFTKEQCASFWTKRFEFDEANIFLERQIERYEDNWGIDRKLF